MLGKTILLHTGDRITARALTVRLRGAGNEVVVTEDARVAHELVAARAIDLALVELETPGALALVEAALTQLPVVAVTTAAQAVTLRELICERQLGHVVCRGDGGPAELARDAVVVVEKLLRAELFGVDKYLPEFGVEVATFEVRGAADRDAVVECLGEHVEWLGAGREARGAVASVVDELVTNAVYNAPRDGDGRPCYAALDRRDKVELAPHEYVTVRWGSDGEVLVVSVSDRFGALEEARVRARLGACLGGGDAIEHKAGGAGLGLFTVLSRSTQLVINVDRGLRTEIIATIDLRRRGQGARLAGHALQLFFDDSRARALDAERAATTSVVVSPALRAELCAQLAPRRRRTELVPRAQATPGASAVRARGSNPPPLDHAVGADTARGLLHGARDVDTAIHTALRFLAHHHRAAVAYAVEGDQLVARQHCGGVRDWARLQAQPLPRTSTAGVAALAGRREVATFRPLRLADARLAMLATGDAAAVGHVIPLDVEGELRWVLYAAGPRDDAPVTSATIDGIRREVEAALCRVDPDAAIIEVSGLG